MGPHLHEEIGPDGTHTFRALTPEGAEIVASMGRFSEAVDAAKAAPDSLCARRALDSAREALTALLARHLPN